MAKYIKIPVVVEAIQWTGKNYREMWDFLGEGERGLGGEGSYVHLRRGLLMIKTPEGEACAEIGDYIINDIKGKYCPCKPDVFINSYEKYVEEGGDKYLKVEEEYKKMLADEYRALSIMGGKHED